MLSFAATRSSALSVLRAARSAPLLRTSRLFSAQPAPVTTAPTPAPAKPKSFFERIWGFQSNTGSAKINRWLMFLPCVGVHICYGTPYAWSVLSGPLTREHGWVSSVASDWTLSQTSLAFPLSFASLGVASALVGKLQMKLGTRKALAISGLMFGGGTMLGALGIHMHSLALLYLGFGVLGGAGIGFSYTPPVQTLIQWFPDRRGLASGIVIAGFGSGSIAFVPIATRLLAKFQSLPQFVGAPGSLTPILKDGKMFAQVGDQLKEVVLATAGDLKRLGQSVAEGYYVVGSGNTGAAATLAVFGAAYLAIVLAASVSVRTPPAGYLPAGYKPPVVTAAASGKAIAATGNCTVDSVMKTPQFYQMFTIMLCMGCGGLGLFAVAKPMMLDIFSSALPTVVTPAFASSYVMMLSVANLGGRVGWAVFSDKFGRRLTFNLFCASSIPLYLAVPACVGMLMANPGSTMPMWVFTVATMAGVANMGAMYALAPAYEADLFGPKYVGAIHGRMLLTAVASALGGSSLILWLRNSSESAALKSLLAKVDPVKFQEFFHAPVSMADQLVQAKSLTINRLMQIMPAGTADPSPFMFNNVMYVMAAFVAVATVAALVLRPVNPKFFERLPAAQPITAQAKNVPPRVAKAIVEEMNPTKKN